MEERGHPYLPRKILGRKKPESHNFVFWGNLRSKKEGHLAYARFQSVEPFKDFELVGVSSQVND